MPGLQNFVLLLLGGICLLFLAVIAVRFRAALRTSHWTQAQATIVTSEPRARRRGETGPETVAHIVYEYSAGGKVHRGEQLKARGIPSSETDLPHFLSRYPVGASTPVYYNPDDPQDAVLEREPLSLSAERLGCLSAFAIIVVLGLVYGLMPLHGLIQRWFPHVDSEDVLVLTTGMGLFLFAFGLVWLRQSLRERRWPSVTGTVVSSSIESFKTMTSSGGGGHVHLTMYRASVIYEYEVEGRKFRSSQIRREKLAGEKEFAEGIIAKYPQGGSVKVQYDPANPADALLEPGTIRGFVVLWLLALAMFGVAASQSGYFRRS